MMSHMIPVTIPTITFTMLWRSSTAVFVSLRDRASAFLSLKASICKEIQWKSPGDKPAEIEFGTDTSFINTQIKQQHSESNQNLLLGNSTEASIFLRSIKSRGTRIS